MIQSIREFLKFVHFAENNRAVIMMIDSIREFLVNYVLVKRSELKQLMVDAMNTLEKDEAYVAIFYYCYILLDVSSLDRLGIY